MMNRRERRSAQKHGKKGRSKASGNVQALAHRQFAEAADAYQSGNLAQATRLTEDLIKKLPPNSDLYKLRGSIELARQNFRKATGFFQEGLQVDPTNSILCDLMGTSLSGAGLFQEAIISFRRALLNDSRNPGTLNNYGLALFRNGDLDEAIKALRESLIYRPGDKSTRLNLAGVWEEKGDFTAAEAIYRDLIGEAPDFIEAYQALGECQMNSHNWPGALQTAEDALIRGLVDAEIYTLKAYALGTLLRFSEAEEALQRALEIEPDRPSALSALSILSFYQEKWLEGWRYYEARRHNPAFESRPFPQPQWKGEDLTGKKVLLWGEQGVGDEIMFATMLPDFLKRGPDATFEMDRRLVPLFMRSFPQLTCIARTDVPSGALLSDMFDYQIPSGSLGQYLRPHTDSFGAGEAYLKPDLNKVEALRQTYGTSGKRLNVGLAWYSSNGRGLSKSIPLNSLEPLFHIPDVQFFDLQYGDTSQEQRAFAEAFNHRLFHDESIDQMASLDDFAAQIAAMDLVISISNSTVHLSGALGVPTWVMLPAAPMQRWLMNRSDSPWYASVELFRQRTNDDLPHVVQTVRNRLAQFGK
ncbi:MAG: tetratricopeptide repeat protein [Rhodospirillales bacterium]|nr:tetratricopeptide repeat protein [Rhodospirillales bacterium]